MEMVLFSYLLLGSIIKTLLIRLDFVLLVLMVLQRSLFDKMLDVTILVFVEHVLQHTLQLLVLFTLIVTFAYLFIAPFIKSLLELVRRVQVLMVDLDSVVIAFLGFN